MEMDETIHMEWKRVMILGGEGVGKRSLLEAYDHLQSGTGSKARNDRLENGTYDILVSNSSWSTNKKRIRMRVDVVLPLSAASPSNRRKHAIMLETFRFDAVAICFNVHDRNSLDSVMYEVRPNVSS